MSSKPPPLAFAHRGAAVADTNSVATAEGAADDLSAAMESRTAINLACGIIMGQNKCSQERAVEILFQLEVAQLVAGQRGLQSAQRRPPP